MENKSDKISDELPSDFADKIGIKYSSLVNLIHKKKNGQFFTPVSIARFMSSISDYNDYNSKSIRIIDPGCGTAVLACALIEQLIKSNKSLANIELTAYETDSKIIPYVDKSLMYLYDWVKDKGINFKYQLNNEDFILSNAYCLDKNENLFYNKNELYDIVICNPPYFKLSSEDTRAIVAKEVTNGHPNIYSIFMAVAARLLKQNGEMIFITPRSFASGNYFKVFRSFIFQLIQTERIHLFISRKDAFSRDSVLQELVILKGKRVSDVKREQSIIISSSTGLRDLDNQATKVYKLNEIIDLDSDEKILHLPTTSTEESILSIFKNWTGSLHKYNIEISTGPVVAFRAKDDIIEEYLNNDKLSAPLFWLHNVKKMTLEWPFPKKGKGQYILVNNKTKSSLIANKNYILLRRFSSKDDKDRLIAAPYFSNFVNSDVIGVENKLNYIYRRKGYLERNEVVGLCAILNSKLFDSFFRIFNGNVNVSATELREMSLPPYEDILDIGNKIIQSNDFTLDNVLTIVKEKFGINNLVYA